ncbi:MAG: hypothetical protein HY329_28585 [Chloroflexi bacterium]|nr:hypothetical protein [Chloroflexota bacterium]
MGGTVRTTAVAPIALDGPEQPPAAGRAIPTSDQIKQRPTGVFLPVVVSRHSASGRVRLESFESEALGRRLQYLVYLPPGYEAGAQRYPVLYLLHGYGATLHQWADYGFFAAAHRMIGSGEIAPLIVITPQGDLSYWVNHSNGGERWGDYLALDLVGHVDGSFRTIAAAHGRAVGGQSMGGFGALQQAMSRPDRFSAVGAHSPSLRSPGDPRDPSPDYLGDAEYFAGLDPIILSRTREGARQVRIWIDHGDADYWRPRVEVLHQTLVDRGIAHEYHVWPGAHTAEYFQAHFADYLSFYNRAFSGAR